MHLRFIFKFQKRSSYVRTRASGSPPASGSWIYEIVIENTQHFSLSVQSVSERK